MVKNGFGDIFCKISLIVMLIIIIHSFLGDLMFRWQYSFPHVSETTQEKINTQNDPIQIDLKNAEPIKTYYSNRLYTFKPMAEYSISGLVVAKNSNFWFRDIMRSDFDNAYLLDLGMVWGDLAKDRKLLTKYAKFNSRKTLRQARQLNWQFKPDTPWEWGYINSHISHTHITPANANVMGGLLLVKNYDVIKLDGYLVDTYNDKNRLIAMTSMSRFDTEASSRGYGSCEEMYVQSVQIGNKIYK